VIELRGAILVPALSEKLLQFTSTQADGPGMLTLTEEGSALLRVSHWNSGFAYVNVESGGAKLSPDQNFLEIPRWSIEQLNAANQLETLFEFSGPTPLVGH
jgi:hypothetical protein